MSTISVILEPHEDGTLHLPIPEEFRFGKVKVEATLESAEPKIESAELKGRKGFGAFKGMIWMAPDFDEPLEDFKEYME